MEINHEELITILNEKDKYEMMKGKNWSNKITIEKQQNMRLNIVNSRSSKKKMGLWMIYISSDFNRLEDM